MIKCKPYKTKFLKPDTCIARQGKLIEIRPSLEKRKDTPPAAYMKVQKCDGCNVGIKLYKEHLKQEKITGKMKRCSRKQCLKLLPADLEHFGKDAKGKDGLSYYCRECQRIASKNYQEKISKKNSKRKLESPKIEQKKTDQQENIPDTPNKIEKPEPKITKPELKKDIKTRECRTCEHTFELTADNFHRKGDGFAYRCKACRNLAKKKYMAKRLMVPENCFMLDLREEPVILEKLKAWAKGNRRLPEQQILYFLENDLKVKGE